METYGVRVTSVQSFRLICSLEKLLARNSTPLPKQAAEFGVLKPSADSTRVVAANYQREAVFCAPFLLAGATRLMRGHGQLGNKLIGERRLLIIVSNGELALTCTR